MSRLIDWNSPKGLSPNGDLLAWREERTRERRIRLSVRALIVVVRSQKTQERETAPPPVTGWAAGLLGDTYSTGRARERSQAKLVPGYHYLTSPPALDLFISLPFNTYY